MKYLDYINDAYCNFYGVRFTAFYEQLAILQRTATNTQVL
jgi:hypothetical protein